MENQFRNLFHKVILNLKNRGIKKTLKKIRNRLNQKIHPLKYPMLTLDEELVEISNFHKKNAKKFSSTSVEFVCPFWRGDVLLALQVACTAALYGKKIRLHVSKDIFPWIQDFPYNEYIEIESLDIKIPDIRDKTKNLNKAIQLVVAKTDFSGLLVCPLPIRSLTDMKIDLVQFMLLSVGLPIETQLLNIKPLEKYNIDYTEYFGAVSPENVVLLHPNGGWKTKSMTYNLVKQISDIVHSKNLRIFQIGGSNDKKFEFLDGFIMRNLSLKIWKKLFTETKAIIGVDSWSAHFASIVNANQAVVMGCTSSKYVSSKRHYKKQQGNFIVFESDCENEACFSTNCKYSGENCSGMKIDSKKLSSWLSDIR